MTDTTGSSSRSSTMGSADNSTTNQNKGTMTSLIQRQQWEAFFKPEYTFESFIHGSTKPLTNNARHKRNIERLMNGIVSSSSQQSLASLMNAPPLSRPASFTLGTTRPALGGATASTASSIPTTGTTANMPTLPTMPDVSTLYSQTASKKDRTESEDAFLKERLELLRKIRMQGKGSGHARNRNSGSDLTASLSREERPCILADEEDNRRQSFIFDTTARWITIAAKQIRNDAKADDSISIISDNGTFDNLEKTAEGNELGEAEGQQGGSETAETKANGGDCCFLACCRRPSLLCFFLGFFCPLFWMLGAIHFSSCANRQTSANRRMDHVWRRRSRIAFAITMLGSIVALIVVFVLKPETIGYRQSQQHQDTRIYSSS